jgi:hypothetical protein
MSEKLSMLLQETAETPDVQSFVATVLQAVERMGFELHETMRDNDELIFTFYGRGTEFVVVRWGGDEEELDEVKSSV